MFHSQMVSDSCGHGMLLVYRGHQQAPVHVEIGDDLENRKSSKGGSRRPAPLAPTSRTRRLSDVPVVFVKGSSTVSPITTFLRGSVWFKLARRNALLGIPDKALDFVWPTAHKQSSQARAASALSEPNHPTVVHTTLPRAAIGKPGAAPARSVLPTIEQYGRDWE